MTQKKNADRFKRKFKLRTVNSAALCDALSEQGFTLIEFNGIRDNKDVSDLISALRLGDHVRQERCFTYQNDKYRLVFIHEDLNEEERTIVLAHEEGHISNGHMTQGSVFGADVVQEFEANEFAHYLLKDKTGGRKLVRIAAAVCSLLLILSFSTGVYLKLRHDKAVYTDNLYRTASGTKYHLRDCMFIKDKTDVYRLTREEFESGYYEPCGACVPDAK